MIHKNLTFDSAQDNILFDEVLLKEAEMNQQEYMRFWESPTYFIVLGLTGKLEQEVLIDQVSSDSIPVLRRLSGGGTVLQGPGCINYTFILRKDRSPKLQDITHSYHEILNGVLLSLEACGVKAAYYPISDLALSESKLKFSGNAQKRSKNYILHHGTILHDFKLELISKYLAYPLKVPDYRNNRSHDEFVTNVSLQIDQFKKSLLNHYNVEENSESMASFEVELLNKIKKERDVFLKI